MLEQLGATVSSARITPRNLPCLGLLKSQHDSSELSIDSEREQIVETLRCTKGNKALAAKLLGVHRSTLYEKIKKYNLNS